MNQIEFYLPPPITAAEAAAILGHFGGKARADRLREPVREKARQMRRELRLSPLSVLELAGTASPGFHR